MSCWRAALLAAAVAASAPALAEDLAPAAAPAPPFTVPDAGRLQLKVSHGFPLAVAHERVTYLLAYWKERFQLKSEWQGETAYLSGQVWGVQVKAVFELQADQILARAEDPGNFWRDRLTAYVVAKLKKYLHPTYADP